MVSPCLKSRTISLYDQWLPLLSPRVLRAAPQNETHDAELLAGLDGSLKDRIEALEKRILRETLIRHRWNKSQASRELGLSRVGLRSKLERYQLKLVTTLAATGSTASDTEH